MANIGKLAVVLTANAQQFESGLAKAGASVGRFGQSAMRVFGGLASGDFVGSLGQNLAMLPGPAGAAASAIAGVGGSLKHAIDRGNEFIGSVASISKHLGVSAAAASALRQAARASSVDTATLETGLFRLERVLGESATGAGEGAVAFRALGLDARMLANVPLDEALEQVARRIQELPTANDRAAASFAIFGRQGKELVGLIDKIGKHGMGKFAADARKLGVALSDDDLKKWRELREESKRLDAIFDGMSARVALALAHGTLEWKKLLVEVMSLVKELAGVFENIVTFIRKGVEGLNNLRRFMGQGGELNLQAPGFNAEAWRDRMDRDLGLGGGGQGMFSVLTGFLESARPHLERFGAALQANEANFAAMQRAAQADIDLEKIAEEIKLRMQLIGLTEEQIRVARLARLGANAEAAQGVLLAQDKLEALRMINAFERETRNVGLSADFQRLAALNIPEELRQIARAALENRDNVRALHEAQQAYLQSLQSDAARVIEQTRTPMERYQAEMSRLQDMFMSGAFGPMNSDQAWNTYARAGLQALERLESAFDHLNRAAQGPTLALAGSAEAIASINRAGKEGRGQQTVEHRLEQIRQLESQELAELRQMNAHLRGGFVELARE